MEGLGLEINAGILRVETSLVCHTKSNGILRQILYPLVNVYSLRLNMATDHRNSGFSQLYNMVVFIDLFHSDVLYPLVIQHSYGKSLCLILLNGKNYVKGDVP